MEDSNSKRGNAMTEPERISMVGHMEKMIREHQIVVAGDAQLIGGFGRLPRSDHLPTRIDNIEKSIKNFSIRVDGFNVAGNFDDGFILW